LTSKQDRAIAATRYRAVVRSRKKEKMKIDTKIRHVTKPELLHHLCPKSTQIQDTTCLFF